MKKLLVMLCVGGLMVGMLGCGNTDDSTSSQSSESVSVSSESSQPTEESSVESSQPEESSSEQTDNAAQGWSEEMQAIKTAVTDALGENYWPNMALEADMLEANFGISADMYDDYLAEMPMISMNVDTLVVIKAKDGQVEAVEEALGQYRNTKVGDTMQYPMNLGKIQASKIETIGNYVCFVQLGADTMEAMDKGDEAVIEHCQTANDTAIEAIRQQVQ